MVVTSHDVVAKGGLVAKLRHEGLVLIHHAMVVMQGVANGCSERPVTEQ